ncbi:integrase core domain-containing protein [Nitrosospira sp. Nsp18]|uniref:integrase core domain-containing protein n=1 Tax=Nitrosospira sp. Nsp18 TaxID=1855334 RepID=UPI003525F380
MVLQHANAIYRLGNRDSANEESHGQLRQDVLEDARRKIDEWRQYYNETRPHSALQWATPAEFARQERENASRRQTREQGSPQGLCAKTYRDIEN